MSTIDAKSGKPPFKRTDYRYQLWVKERKALRSKAKKSSFKVELVSQPKSKYTVTVDTSKARSTLDVVRTCLKELGWREYPFGKKDGGMCDLYWNAIHFTDAVDLPGGKVNKFPGMADVVRKVNLGRSLDISRSLFPDDYTFHPRQWFLPQQYAEFSDACRRMNDKAEKHKQKRPVFIVKPDEGSQGDGIYIIHEPRDYMLLLNKSHVVQEYIANPFLIDGLKFDFRVYVVLANLDPLEIYICKEGLARFCTVAYETPTTKNLHESFMHLTNYSLNKRSSTYVHTESDDDGSKRTMSSVFKIIEAKGYNVDKLWNGIKNLVVKTIISCYGELKAEQRIEIPLHKAGPGCFQILGFDVLIDEQCKPYLLEVNANPSLRIDYERELAPGIFEHVHSPVDEDIKKPLIYDTLLLMAPKHKTRGYYNKKLHGTKSAPSYSESNREYANYSDDDSEDEYENDGKVGDRSYQKSQKGYNTLEEIYPGDIDDLFDDLRILETAADIFIESLGVRIQKRLGHTGFRNFTRRCKVTGTGPGFSNASLDILYIDLQKRWDHMSSDSSAGLCFQGFVEALLYLAKKKNPTMDKYNAVKSFLDYCEKGMDEERSKRNSGKGRVGMFPQISKSDRAFRQDELTHIYGGSGRKKLGNSFFIDYKKTPTVNGGGPMREATVTINDKNNKKTLRKSKIGSSKSLGDGVIREKEGLGTGTE